MIKEVEENKIWIGYNEVYGFRRKSVGYHKKQYQISERSMKR